eukprot:6213052-Pleurochrysis_carterae.AAC.3
MVFGRTWHKLLPWYSSRSRSRYMRGACAHQSAMHAPYAPHAVEERNGVHMYLPKNRSCKGKPKITCIEMRRSDLAGLPLTLLAWK